MTHLLPLLDERGIQSQTAILAASMIGPMQVAGRLAVIAAGQRVPAVGIFAACFVAMGIAAASLLGSRELPVLLISFILFQGTGYGITSIMRPVITSEMLGHQNFGLISGYLAVPFLSAAAAAPTIAALVWRTGGYNLVIGFALGVSALGFFSLMAAAKLSTRTSS